VTADLAKVTRDPELAPLWAGIHDRLCAGYDPGSIIRVHVRGLSLAGVADTTVMAGHQHTAQTRPVRGRHWTERNIRSGS
jgi:hypothetical protein